MFKDHFEGECPRCLLDDKENKMIKNQDDFFECPECSLLALRSQKGIVILPKEGDGIREDYRESPIKAEEVVEKEPLGVDKNTDKESFDEIEPARIRSEQDLREYFHEYL